MKRGQRCRGERQLGSSDGYGVVNLRLRWLLRLAWAVIP